MTSVGSRGDSFDNALAETIIGLYKTELIRRRGPWKGLDEVEYATLEWVDWFNHRRLLEPIGHVPPVELRPLTIEGRTPATLLDSSNRASDEPRAVQLIQLVLKSGARRYDQRNDQIYAATSGVKALWQAGHDAERRSKWLASSE